MIRAGSQAFVAADGPRWERAWRHLDQDPYGLRISRGGTKDAFIEVSRTSYDSRTVRVRLSARGLDPAREELLATLGWLSPPAVGDWSRFELSRPTADRLDPGLLAHLASSTMEIVTGQPRPERELRIQAVDFIDDAGWTQGCLLAAPGMIVGALVGLAVWTHLIGMAFGELAVGALVLIGVAIGYLGGALLAATAYRICGKFAVTRPVQTVVSRAAWLIGGLLAPILLAGVTWSVMGW